MLTASAAVHRVLRQPARRASLDRHHDAPGAGRGRQPGRGAPVRDRRGRAVPRASHRRDRTGQRASPGRGDTHRRRRGPARFRRCDPDQPQHRWRRARARPGSCVLRDRHRSRRQGRRARRRRAGRGPGGAAVGGRANRLRGHRRRRPAEPGGRGAANRGPARESDRARARCSGGRPRSRPGTHSCPSQRAAGRRDEHARPAGWRHPAGPAQADHLRRLRGGPVRPRRDERERAQQRRARQPRGAARGCQRGLPAPAPRHARLVGDRTRRPPGAGRRAGRGRRAGTRCRHRRAACC